MHKSLKIVYKICTQFDDCAKNLCLSSTNVPPTRIELVSNL